MADEVGSGRKPRTITQNTCGIAKPFVAQGLMPLDYMLSIMRDETADAPRRDEMAKAAAPYIHPRLATIEQRPPTGKIPPLAERIAELERRDAIALSENNVVDINIAPVLAERIREAPKGGMSIRDAGRKLLENGRRAIADLQDASEVVQTAPAPALAETKRPMTCNAGSTTWISKGSCG